MSDRTGDRLRLRSDIDACGRDRIVRCVLKQDDPFVMYGLLETLAIMSNDSVELIASFELLRARRFPLEDLVARKKRARSYLLTLVGEAPEPERLLVN